MNEYSDNELDQYGGIIYPDIDDPEFNTKITKIFQKYEIPKKKKTYDEYCFPKSYTLQNSQLLASQYINQHTPYRKVLIYHKIGSGKTATAIAICEQWKNKRNIIVVLPASLRGSFRDELKSSHIGNQYLHENERNQLAQHHPSSKEYKLIVKKSDERIDQVYNIYSYNKFIDLCKDQEINLKNTVLIVDEIQNMISEDGTYYEVLFDTIKDAPKDLVLVLLSATPVFDKIDEIALTMNLLLDKKNEFPTGNNFYKKFIKTTIHETDNGVTYHHHLKNIDLFKQKTKGLISYFAGAPEYTFPEAKIKYVRCKMSDFQYGAYKTVLKNNDKNFTKNKNALDIKEMSNSFFLATRNVSNVVFPNKLVGEDGLNSMKKKQCTDELEKYSVKFAKLINKIEKRGKHFVYSGFKQEFGLATIAHILKQNGYKSYKESGPGKNTFAFFTGDENSNFKSEIKAVYNNVDNLHGNKLKIILASPSAKEGLSLYAVKYVHVMEQYWNQSRMFQVFGRSLRFCAHKDLPLDERIVKIYVYLAVHPDEKQTVDEYIYELAQQKAELVKEIEMVMRESASDCMLFRNANNNEKDNVICDK